MTLYEELLAAGIKLSSHNSDLYVSNTPLARRIIENFANHGGTTNRRFFVNQATGEEMIELPFHFTPWWTQRSMS